MASSPELRITGIGCVTSIGGTAVAGASAFRAGIVRPAPLAFVDVDDGPVTGRPIAGLTDGFVQFGLWLRLAGAALDDLLANSPPHDDEAWRRTAVVACLPHLDEDRFSLPTDDLGRMLRDAFFEPLLENAGVPIRPENCRAAFGHCAAAIAVGTAHELLEKDAQLQRVLLLAADSTCDAQSLAWLSSQHRLKTADHPVGLIPAEAGAAILVERSRTAKGSAAALATLHRAAVTASSDAKAAAHDTGRRLADVIREVLARHEPATCEVWSDQNGEPWRAEAWGHAAVHLQRHPPTRDVQPTLTASSLGELGAATGLLAAVFATRAFVRRHARTDLSLVCSVDERRGVGAFIVGRA